ncbi:MAG: carotenoid 1,2-hydratase [Desulfomonile tiedjei]|nr:carotenoid 1,2-hydratase [Desulfomonile tiedjei]
MIRGSVVAACVAILSVLPAVGAESPFEDAIPGRVLHFPADHGKHPTFQTEWWYFTGNLQSEGGRPWGFQLTFFRRGYFAKPARHLSAWAVRDVYPAHFALADVQTRTFFHTELLSREGPGLAGSAAEDLDVHVRDWSAQRTGDRVSLKAREGDYALDLTLTPEKPVVLHGRSGYSRKGDSPTQASYYYSFTRMAAEGSITFRGVQRKVNGLAWMDHEFGSSLLLKDQVGWDWFSLQLDDGTELMVFHLRKKDGTFEQPFGTFVPKEGAPVRLSGRQIAISATRQWTSPHTKATYPSEWTIEVPDQNLELRVTPLMHDQELATARSTRIVYWEGAVTATGSRIGRAVHGKGYGELTGYAHSMGGKL